MHDWMPCFDSCPHASLPAGSGPHCLTQSYIRHGGKLPIHHPIHQSIAVGWRLLAAGGPGLYWNSKEKV